MPEVKKLKVGDKAPMFSLKDQKGRTVKLKEVLEKQPVVLIFYPGDMTPGCTIQLCSIRDQWPKFEKANAKVFGINHGSAKSHQAFIEKHQFPFPLLIDANKTISKKFGAIKKIFSSEVIKRTVVAIDQSGKIVFYRTGMPKEADILKALTK